MLGLKWSTVNAFVRDVASADDERLREMYEWAEQRMVESDRAGRGRNPRARRMYRQMRDAVAEQLDQRGLLWSR